MCRNLRNIHSSSAGCRPLQTVCHEATVSNREETVISFVAKPSYVATCNKCCMEPSQSKTMTVPTRPKQSYKLYYCSIHTWVLTIMEQPITANTLSPANHKLCTIAGVFNPGAANQQIHCHQPITNCVP